MNNTTIKHSVYQYRPVSFFIVVYALTWLFWGIAIYFDKAGMDESVFTAFMLLGLLIPSVTSFCMVQFSKNNALKRDYRRKIFGLKDLRPLDVVIPVVTMALIIAVSISVSLLFGQPAGQFSFVGGFSFSIGSMPTLLTLIITAILEELGWRGYAEDAIASRRTWSTASLIFGVIWSLWHLPLIFISGTYQNEILLTNPWFAVNFFISIIPMGFVLTWVYVKNKRSIFACAIFHFFVNFLQEQIAMTQVTKCIETFIVIAAAAIIVAANKKLFFEKNHIGNILEE